MTDLNKAMLIGRLTQTPETKAINSGQSVTTFSIATNKSWVDKSGNKKDQVEYHNIEAWGKLSEICSTYLTKGKQVFVSGRLKTQSWEDKNGIKKYKTSIVLEDMQMLDSKGDDTAPAPTPAQTKIEPEEINIDEDGINIADVPF